MTTTGEHQRDVRPSGGVPHRRLPRTIALLSLLAVAAVGCTWAEVHFSGRIHLGHRLSADGVSQDSVGLGAPITAPGLGGIGQAQVDDVLPTTVGYPATVTSPKGFQGVRYAMDARTADCGAVLAPQAPAAVTTGCAGYLTADYVQQSDHALYSSVTVLYYPNPATATRVARLLKAPQAAAADLLFRQPGDGLPMTASDSAGAAGRDSGALASSRVGGLTGLGGTAPLGGTASPTPGTTSSATSTSSATATPSATKPSATPTPSATAGAQVAHDPADAATMTRVAAVGRTVTVVQSVFADGRPPDSELDTPTWYLTYTVATALSWEPDQPAASTSPAP